MAMSSESQKLQAAFLLGVKQIERSANQIFEQRGHLYNENRAIPEFFLHGAQDTIYEIYKKVLRLDSLVSLDALDKECLDSVVDIINYAKFTGSLLLLQKGMKLNEDSDN